MTCDCGHSGPDVRRTGSGNECSNCKEKRLKWIKETEGVKPTNAVLGLPKFSGRGTASRKWITYEEEEWQRDPNRVPGWAWPEFAKAKWLLGQSELALQSV